MVDQVPAAASADATDDKPPPEYEIVALFASLAFVVAVYFVLPMLGKPVPTVPESVFLMLGGPVSVAAWHRGRNRGLAQ